MTRAHFRVRTGEGIARIPLRVRGVWYVEFINMTRIQGETVDYESKMGDAYISGALATNVRG